MKLGRVTITWNQDKSELAALTESFDNLAEQIKLQGEKLTMLGDQIQSADTTLHQDLVAEDGLIKQLLTAFAAGQITPTQAQVVIDSMNADDATAKTNIAAITAVITPPTGGSAPA